MSTCFSAESVQQHARGHSSHSNTAEPYTNSSLNEFEGLSVSSDSGSDSETDETSSTSVCFEIDTSPHTVSHAAAVTHSDSIAYNVLKTQSISDAKRHAAEARRQSMQPQVMPFTLKDITVPAAWQTQFRSAVALTRSSSTHNAQIFSQYGQALIRLRVTAYLFAANTSAPPQELTVLRQRCMRGDTIARVADRLLSTALGVADPIISDTSSEDRIMMLKHAVGHQTLMCRIGARWF